MAQAVGSFEVKVVPQKESEGVSDPSLGRMSLHKQFYGDLIATSKGQMLSAMTETKGSAGYVAMERVVGELGGREGSFVLQHTGTMDRGKPGLLIRVVPDSGTGELKGLFGEMTIQIEGGGHRYEFSYDFASHDGLASA